MVTINTADAALLALVSVLPKIETGKLDANDDDRKGIARAMEHLAMLGMENECSPTSS